MPQAIRVISALLIITFSAQDIIWAIPDTLQIELKTTRPDFKDAFNVKYLVEKARRVAQLIDGANPSKLEDIMKWKGASDFDEDVNFEEIRSARAINEIRINIGSGQNTVMLRYYCGKTGRLPSGFVRAPNYVMDREYSDGKFARQLLFAKKLQDGLGLSTKKLPAAKRFNIEVVSEEHFSGSVAGMVAENIVSLQTENGRMVNICISPGNTVISMLRDLARYNEDPSNKRKPKIDWRRVRLFPLAEFKMPHSIYSIRHFFEVNFLRHLDTKNKIKPENIFYMGGSDFDPPAYSDRLKAMGSLDIAVLGIGTNGHIGLNEPGTPFSSRTREVALDAATVNYYADEPEYVFMKTLDSNTYTLGMADIFESGKIFLLAKGAAKSPILSNALFSPINEGLPASMLQRHPDLTVVADNYAARDMPYAAIASTTWISEKIAISSRIIRSAGIDRGLTKFGANELAKRLALEYLDFIVTENGLEELIKDFGLTGKPVSQIDRYIQQKVFEYYYDNRLDFSAQIPYDDPEEEKKVEKLFMTGLRVYKFFHTRYLTDKRKELLASLILVNIRPEAYTLIGSKTSSVIRSVVARRLVVDEVLFDKDPTISTLARRTVLDLLVTYEKGLYFDALYPLLADSGNISRSAKDVVDMLVAGRKEGNAALCEKIKRLIIKLATASRGFNKAILEYIYNLHTVDDNVDDDLIRSIEDIVVEQASGDLEIAATSERAPSESVPAIVNEGGPSGREPAPDQPLNVAATAAATVREEGGRLRQEFRPYLEAAGKFFEVVEPGKPLSGAARVRLAELNKIHRNLLDNVVTRSASRHNIEIFKTRDTNTRLFWMALAATIRHKVSNKGLQAITSIIGILDKNTSGAVIDRAVMALKNIDIIISAFESMTEVRVPNDTQNDAGFGEFYIDGLDDVKGYPYVVDAPQRPARYAPAAAGLSDFASHDSILSAENAVPADGMTPNAPYPSTQPAMPQTRMDGFRAWARQYLECLSDIRDFVVGLKTISDEDRSVQAAALIKRHSAITSGGVLGLDMDKNTEGAVLHTIAKKGVFVRLLLGAVSKTDVSVFLPQLEKDVISELEPLSRLKRLVYHESKHAFRILIEPSLKSETEALAEVGLAWEDLGQTAQLKDGARILLSENLFRAPGNDEEFTDIKLALAPLINTGMVDIMPADKILTRTMNGKVSKDKLCAVFAAGDVAADKLEAKRDSIRSSVLIVDSKLSGRGYLYLKGVIGLAAALMSGKREPVRHYYEMLSGQAPDDEIMDLLKDDNSINNIAFALKAILRLIPITEMDDREFEKHRREMENFLIAA